jgi:probable addiction module antidote protein
LQGSIHSDTTEKTLNTFLRSSAFDDWLTHVLDQKAKARILARIASAVFLEILAIVDRLAREFPRCEFMSSGIPRLLRANRIGHLHFARRRHKNLPDERHREGEENGSRSKKGETVKKGKNTYKPFDAASYLDNDVVIAEYLSAAAEDPKPEVFLAALGDVAKARGIAQIAKDSGLGRESLYKTLSAGAHPRFETINLVLHALGVKFSVVVETES